MNGLVQLTPQSTASPLKSQSILSEDELSSSFSDAFIDASINAAVNSTTNKVAAGDGIKSGIDRELVEGDGDNITNYRSITEAAISEEPEPLKPDLDIALASIVESKQQEVLTGPRAEAGGAFSPEKNPEAVALFPSKPMQESVAESPIPVRPKIVPEPAHDRVQGDTARQDKALVRSGHLPPLADHDAFEMLKPPAENMFSKAARSREGVPAKIVGLEQKIISGLAPDEKYPSVALRPGPAPAAKISAPATTIETVMAQNASVSSIAPALPIISSALPPSISGTISARVTPVVPTLNMDTGNEWIARLSQDIGQLSTEKPELNFQLKPEHMGKLSVKITAGAAGDIVRMETENESVKALIIGSQTRLEQDIRLSGLKLSRVDVMVQDDAQFDQEAGPRDGGSGHGATGEGLLRDAQQQDQSPKSQSHGLLAERDLFAQNGRNGNAATSPHYGARYA